ncbi:uncharacterized protein LOC133635815 isoform X2 [Entelurus aequoreus]|uniref:uncharacterized protein LOC133635815 isoform X2 n=1 Tax=Entelurus aequoreus TaxID=161455 RepID=UPI002B1D9C93|nr:uncharacterized protein LOC133635815 isoform X2 [Entelurus aequoreus]
MCERTIAEYEEELCPTKEEKERQYQLLDAVFKKHQVVLHRTEVQQPPYIKEEALYPPCVKEEEPKPHIKEEEEEVWIRQEGECLLGQEEADLTKFPLTVVSVKTEDHEDKPPESSQLYHSPNVCEEHLLPEQQEGTFKREQEEPQPHHIKEGQAEPQHSHIKVRGLGRLLFLFNIRSQRVLLFFFNFGGQWVSFLFKVEDTWRLIFFFNVGAL